MGGGKGSLKGGKGHFIPGGRGQRAINPSPAKPPTAGELVASGKKIFVGALPKLITQEVLANHFSSFGEVEEVKLMYDLNHMVRGFGFVTFKNQESAQKVLDNYYDNMMDGKWLDCRSASEQEHIPRNAVSVAPPNLCDTGPPPTGSVLRVRGVPHSSSAVDILKFFKDFSPQRVAIRGNRQGMKMGDALVEFRSTVECVGAWANLNGKLMGHRYIETFEASEQDLQRLCALDMAYAEGVGPGGLLGDGNIGGGYGSMGGSVSRAELLNVLSGGNPADSRPAPY